MTLTPSQVQFYEDSGYLVLERLLAASECDELCAEAERVADGHYANILDLHVRSKAFHRQLADSGILALADQIQRARMIPIGSIFFFCKPGNPLEQGSAWHQDNYAPKAPYGSYLVCAVALDDADAANGALCVVPGTHRLGDLPSKPSKNFEFDATGKIEKAYPIGNEVAIPDGYAPVTLAYPRGSAIFIHAHLIHGADRNPSALRWRRAVYFHYIKDGDPFWPGWNAKRQLIERGPGYR
jgi:ectoine hydroxylase-related dioxygenase (phytanoyl-CoA dioxygenase family)